MVMYHLLQNNRDLVMTVYVRDHEGCHIYPPAWATARPPIRHAEHWLKKTQSENSENTS